MKINDQHRLCDDAGKPVPFQASPNHGGTFTELKFLVMHYTAGRSAENAANWLCSPQAKASAHLVISKDGSCIQLVPFNVIAWHAGESQWSAPAGSSKKPKVYKGLNKFSIGIELDNPGRLVMHGDKWRSLSLGTVYPAKDGIQLTHKLEQKPAGWHVYPAAQLETAREVAHLLVERYGLADVLGHDDIAPDRKRDPGPAFDMDNFRAGLFGRG